MPGAESPCRGRSQGRGDEAIKHALVKKPRFARGFFFGTLNLFMPIPIDLCVDARWIVPIEPAGALEHHTLVVDGGCIVAVIPTASVERDYAPRERATLPTHALLPGLVNTHTHAAMTLLRGIADDLPLDRWLTEHIFPAEGKNVSPEFVYDGTLLAALEMIEGGTTTFADMYYFE